MKAELKAKEPEIVASQDINSEMTLVLLELKKQQTQLVNELEVFKNKKNELSDGIVIFNISTRLIMNFY